MSTLPTWFYFERPTHLAFHDLTSTTTPPKNLRSLLGLGSKFCPTPAKTTSDISSTVDRFNRDIELRAFFGNSDINDDGFDKKLYVKSSWTPPPWKIPPEVTDRAKTFTDALKSTFKKRHGRPNLLGYQRDMLRELRQRDDILIVQCDKNLGPACIEKEKYIELAFRDHLGDKSTYKLIPPTRVDASKERIRTLLTKWIKKNKKVLTPGEKRFLRHHLKTNEEPFPVFYLLMKVHKLPLKTQPIVSCIGSLLHPLGVWIDRKMQVIAKKQKSFFGSSFVLKEELVKMELPPGALLFTSDAVSMYTNIPTGHALFSIGQYLRRKKKVFQDVPMEALIKALGIVMRNNFFTFGDTTWHQLSGTAMGTPPAPPYATLYYAIHEDTLLDEYDDNLQIYRRYIDDVFGIWKPSPGHDDDARWLAFTKRMNDFPGLTWETSDRSTSVNYMDLTISIRDDKIHTTLYEKSMNPYLYIPPHSAHPPGVLTGLVFGNIHRISSLCSDSDDRKRLVQQFYRRLLVRGYQPSMLTPLFREADARLKQPKEKDEDKEKGLFLHLQYHPNDPPSSELQQLWRDHISEPDGKTPLAEVPNLGKPPLPIGIRRMIVAYSRPPNLGNILSYRKLRTPNGRPVSSYIK